MTTPPPGNRSARAAGFLLLGIAAIALVIGVITLFGGSGKDNAGPTPSPSTTTTSAAPPTSPQPPPSTSVKPPPASTSSSTPPPATTTTTTAKPPPHTSAPPSTHAQPVRIYNNSTIHGLAAQAAKDIRGGGWNVVEVGNYSQGIIATATVYYRPGTAEEAAARELARTYGLRVEPRFAGIQAASPGVIVIVTNDYTGKPGKG
ncbi:LytR C-terminal domain-containing protein [Labedaea rhizosphaerae]|uniref:LytR cell envelope-related transcriptional attenuator n=1 Tax=Labedaea rhizosphaerae TaxID=598644 RepID=A0A4R6SL78_LABRH|nr:LytR C-terminal domain-containing protein [Labedaea rhizosphaerae]TDQ04614.1 LytR cell envelope-related transcriptional attenuator [Labedaea rhizosphaerae]